MRVEAEHDDVDKWYYQKNDEIERERDNQGGPIRPLAPPRNGHLDNTRISVAATATTTLSPAASADPAQPRVTTVSSSLGSTSMLRWKSCPRYVSALIRAFSRLSGAASPSASKRTRSGRTMATTRSPTEQALCDARNIRPPLVRMTVAPASASTTTASMRFEPPMKSATNVLAGRS